MIRFILCLTHLILFLVCMLPVRFVLWFGCEFGQAFMPSKEKAEELKLKKDLICLRLVQWALRVVRVIAGTEAEIVGIENIPKDRPVLFIGNHRSFFDVILSYPQCPLPTGYISKKELGYVPMLAGMMTDLHCLFLDRKDIRQGLQIILQAIELVKTGTSIAIYPEGTRYGKGIKSLPEDFTEPILPFHEASFKIAQKTGCMVVPMTMVGSERIFEDHLPAVKKARIILTYGRPIDAGALSKEELKTLPERVRREMIKTYAEAEKRLIV